jgi:hypothetical protein
MTETVTVAAPDGAVGAVRGMSGREYRARGGGLYDMTPSDARALRQAGGFTPSLGSPRTGGYPCGTCGFHALFTTCSRCGATNERTAA